MIRKSFRKSGKPRKTYKRYKFGGEGGNKKDRGLPPLAPPKKNNSSRTRTLGIALQPLGPHPYTKRKNLPSTNKTYRKLSPIFETELPPLSKHNINPISKYGILPIITSNQ